VGVIVPRIVLCAARDVSAWWRGGGCDSAEKIVLRVIPDDDDAPCNAPYSADGLAGGMASAWGSTLNLNLSHLGYDQVRAVVASNKRCGAPPV